MQQEASGHGSLAGATAPAAAVDGQQLQADGAATYVINWQEDRASGGPARPARAASQHEPLLLNGPCDSAALNGEKVGGGDSGNGEGAQQSPVRAKKAVTFSSVVEVWGLSNQSSFISEESDDETHLKQVIASSIIGNTLVSEEVAGASWTSVDSWGLLVVTRVRPGLPPGVVAASLTKAAPPLLAQPLQLSAAVKHPPGSQTVCLLRQSLHAR